MINMQNMIILNRGAHNDLLSED